MTDKNLVQYKAYIDKQSGSIVCNTMTVNSTLTAQQIICSPATQGAALHIYGDPDYSAELAFMTGTDKLFEVGTTTTNVTPSTGNFFFIYNNQNSTYSMQIITGSPQSINLNGDVNIYGGLGISTNATINATTINTNNVVASYSGSTGTAYLSQPFTGSGYKKVVMMFESYTAPTSTITFTFPVAFESTLSEYATYNPYPLDITLNTDNVIIAFDTTATYTTSLVIEGW